MGLSDMRQRWGGGALLVYSLSFSALLGAAADSKSKH